MLEAIERIIMPVQVKNVKFVFFVGLGGLIINLFGLCLFGGGHGHVHDDENRGEHNHGEHEHMNITAVWLHILGDFLVSIVVIFSNGVLWYYHEVSEQQIISPNQNLTEITNSTETISRTSRHTSANSRLLSNEHLLNQPDAPDPNIPYFTLLIDPVCSLILVIIVIFMTLKVIKQPIFILLQAVPNGIDLIELQEKVMSIQGVKYLTDLHVWRLDKHKIIGTVHIYVESMENWHVIKNEIDGISETFKIYKFTVQPNVIQY